MQITSWNVCFVRDASGTEPAKFVAWSRKLERARLVFVKIDIVLLQEVHGGEGTIGESMYYCRQGLYYSFGLRSEARELL